jgi:uncharacterized protein with NRDE domain
MCTLIALHRCISGAPLVVAANRDEFLERPAEGPALRETSYGIILAPRDLLAGGTWLGLNSSGLFAALTNQTCESTDPSRRSRGLLVQDVLSATRVDEAATRIEELATDLYNPFNLFLADGENAAVVAYSGRPRRIDLQPGAHVIGNVAPNETSAKLERQRVPGEKAVNEPTGEVLDHLANICRDHTGAPARSATCVHAGSYGTSSSMLLKLGDRPGAGELRFAGGSPCEFAYEDFTPLLQRMEDISSHPHTESAPRGYTR